MATPDTGVFVGLGQMGLPMAKRCIAAGFKVRGADPSGPARDALAAAGGEVFAGGREAAKNASIRSKKSPTRSPSGKTISGEASAQRRIWSDVASGSISAKVRLSQRPKSISRIRTSKQGGAGMNSAVSTARREGLTKTTSQWSDRSGSSPFFPSGSRGDRKAHV